MSRIQLLCRSLPTLATSPEPLLETFAPFPRLPHELRNKIWKYAANVSRNVTVIIGRQYRTQIDQPPAPSILQATQESRTEAMRYYTLCMDYAGPPPLLGRNLGGKVYPPVWINFTVDLFLIGTEAFFHNREVQTKFNFDDSVLSRIQRVEMECYGGIDMFKRHMNTFRKILVQERLVHFKVDMVHRVPSQGHSWLEKELSCLIREEQFRQMITNQQECAGCNVQPHIVWKRKFCFCGKQLSFPEGWVEN